MDNKLLELVTTGLRLVGSDSEMTWDDTQILRAWLAEGYYSFARKNKTRTSQKSAYAWMVVQAKKAGVNQK